MTEFPFLQLTLIGAIGFIGTIVGYLSATLRNLVFPFNVVAASILITCTAMSRFLLPLCPQPHLHVPDSVAWVVGLPIFVAGVLMMVLAISRIGLPAASSPPRRRWELVTGGIYRRMRHPIYLGEILWPIGWALLFKAEWALAITPLWVVLLLIIAVIEERRLSEEFGEQYVGYKSSVPFIGLRPF